MKKVTIFTLILFVLFMCVSCSSSDGGEKPKDSTLNGLVTEQAEEPLLECVIGVRDNQRIHDEYIIKLFFKDQFNLDVEFRYYDVEATPDMLFEGEKAIDMAINVTHDIGPWIDAGYIQDLGEYEADMSDYWNLWDAREDLIKMYNRSAFSIHSNGKFHGANMIYRNLYPQAAWFYRKDIFDRLDIEFPERIEDLQETAEAIRQSTGGYPILEYDGWLGTGIFSSYGTYPRGFFLVHNENNIKYSMAEDNWPGAFETYKNLHDNGYVLFAQAANNIEVEDRGMAMTYAPVSYINYLKKINENWAIAPVCPLADNCTGALCNMIPDGNINIMCISSLSEPELKSRLASFINWTVTREGVLKTWFGDEGRTYSVVDGKVGLLTDDITWISPGNLMVGNSAGASYDLATLEGRFRMTVPDWENTLYCQHDGIKIQADAKIQCTNAIPAAVVSFNEGYSAYHEYVLIREAERDFWNRFNNNMDELNQKEVLDFMERSLGMDYAKVIDEYDKNMN